MHTASIRKNATILLQNGQLDAGCHTLGKDHCRHVLYLYCIISSMTNNDIVSQIRAEHGIWPDVHYMPYTDGGWFLPCNAELCEDFIGTRTECVVELGSWLGMSTRWLLQNTMPHCHVIAIDHWKGSLENQSDPIVSTIYERFLNNCMAYKDRLTPLRMDTVTGLELLKERGLKPDLFFVDAGHDYESAKRDITTCLEFGCPIVGDDFNPVDWPGVTKAVWEIARDRNLKVQFKFKAWSMDPMAQ